MLIGLISFGCNDAVKVQPNRLLSQSSPALPHWNWDIFFGEQMEGSRACEGINAVVMDGVTVLVCDCLLSPVSVRRCQAEWVHVSQRGGGDAISTHSSNHGVCSSFQKQAHQLKVSWSGIMKRENNTFRNHVSLLLLTSSCFEGQYLLVCYTETVW